MMMLTLAFAVPVSLEPAEGHLAKHHQVLSGVQIEGADLSMVNGALLGEELFELQVNTTPTVTEEQAEQIVLQSAGQGILLSLQLRVLPSREQLVWMAEVQQPFVRQRWYVNAHTGAVRKREIKAHAWANVYFERSTSELSVVELPGLDEDHDQLSGELVSVFGVRFENGAPVSTSRALADSSGDFLYEPEPQSTTDAFVEAHAYFHLHRAATWYQERFSHPLPERTTANVNYQTAPGTPYENAYFTYGQAGNYSLVFGQGQTTDFAMEPDIIVHEFSHGVVEDLTTLLPNISYPVNIDKQGMHVGPAGLVEGLPDYFSTSMFGDPNLAEGFEDGSLRRLDQFLTCPEDLFGEAHADGEVVAAGLWAFRGAVGAELSDQVVYRSISQLPDAPTIADLATVLVSELELAKERGEASEQQVNAGVAALNRRGFLQCGRSALVQESQPVVTQFLGADVLGSPDLCLIARASDIRLTPSVQFRVQPPEEVSSVQLRFEFEPTGDEPLQPGDLDYQVVVRSGELVSYTVGDLELFGYSISYNIDPKGFDSITQGAPTEIMLSSEDLDFNQPIYVSLLGSSCRSTKVTATVEYQIEPIEATPAGCGCGQSPGSWYALLAFPLVFRRRRAPLS